MPVMNAMILAPLVYIVIIVGSMATFSSLYRKRQALQAASMEPWFKPSSARDMYLTLLHLPESGAKVPDSVLRAALIQRAVNMIHRAISVKNAKQPLQQLLQRGSVGDDTWTQFQAYEKELDKELREIIEEANSLSPAGNWGQTIFQSAAEIAHNERFKKKVDIQEEKTAEMAKWWEAKTAKIRSEFLKSEGVDDDSKPAAEAKRPVSAGNKSVSESAGSPAGSPAPIPATLVTPAPSTTSQTNGGSDEDVVVVDSEAGPAASSPAGSPAMSPAARSGSISGGSANGGSMRKKKKGKK